MYPRMNLTPSKEKGKRTLEYFEEPSLTMSSKFKLKLIITPNLREQLKRFLRESSEGYFIPDLKDDEAHSKAWKLKASNFPVSKIIIGYWKRESVYEGDLMAKCYFAKKKLVWEFLDGGLKSKMEIHWAQILSLRAQLIEGQPGILEVELAMTPQFFREIDPQPKKHTQWKPVGDFTGGQAYIHRRHRLIFQPEVLNKHYENLLRSDSRLHQCSLKPFPSQVSPYFEPTFNTIPNLPPHSSGITDVGFQLQDIQIPSSSYRADLLHQLTLHPFLQDKDSMLPLSDTPINGAKRSGPCQDISMQLRHPNIQQHTKIHPPQVNPCDQNHAQNPLQQASLYDTPQASYPLDIKVNPMERGSSWMHYLQSQVGEVSRKQANFMGLRRVHQPVSSGAQDLQADSIELEVNSLRHNYMPALQNPTLAISNDLPMISTREINEATRASMTLETHTGVVCPYQSEPPKRADSFEELMGSKSVADSSLKNVFGLYMDDPLFLGEDYWYPDLYASTPSAPETPMELQDLSSLFDSSFLDDIDPSNG